MNKLLFTLLLLPCASHSADWLLIGSTEDYDTYIDQSSVKPKDGFISALSLTNYRFIQNGQVWSNKALVLYDCTNRSDALDTIWNYSEHDGKGELIDFLRIPTKLLIFAPSKSFSELALDNVCDIAGKK